MTSTSRVIVAGCVGIILGSIAAVSEGIADPFPGKTFTKLMAAIFLGLGASLVASGLAARLISNQVVGLDFGEALEALRGSSPVTRSNQTIEITLRAAGDVIEVKAEHRFDLVSSFRRTRRLPLRMYTDVGRWGAAGGFACVVEPDGNSLRGELLTPFVKEVAGKPQFEKVFDFRPGRPESFIAETYATFRLTDRLIWTIEHISRDLKLRVNDYSRLTGDVDIKVNHHRSREITDAIRVRNARDGTVREVDFVSELLPYQGFELQWHKDVAQAAAVGE